jgi:hypothetical protein
MSGLSADCRTDETIPNRHRPSRVQPLAQLGKALGRLAGAARPAGMLVVEDIDFAGHFCYPSCLAYYLTMIRAMAR